VRARPPARPPLTGVRRIFHRIPLHVQWRPPARRRRAQLCPRRADTHRHPPTALPFGGVRFREVRRRLDARQRKGVHAPIPPSTLTPTATQKSSNGVIWYILGVDAVLMALPLDIAVVSVLMYVVLRASLRR
jgi:hypothetical protein